MKRARFLWRRWRNRNSALAPLALVGDSHLDYFIHAADRDWLGPRQYDACPVAGATAVGLRNPNAKSQTGAVAIFEDFLARMRRDAVVIVQLGEVDCGFVIWYRAEKYRDSVERQMDESIAAYFAFVDRALGRGHRDIVVTGATMPTIADGQDWGDVANARRDVAATLSQRTELTRRYNRRLEAEALRRGLAFVDIGDEALDPATGTARRDLLNRNAFDHHMDKDRAAAIWARRLNPILARYRRGARPAAAAGDSRDADASARHSASG